MTPSTRPPDRRWMRRALVLARRGWGRTAPNPMVGAVVVRDGDPVGEGWHREFGGPHAEVVALEAAGERARGATVYVTLEPCAHRGKTPPCTEALLEAGVRRVVYAVGDPTVEAGGGGERLAGAGVEVVSGVLEEEARRLNAAFFHAATAESPYVALKLALSLDGRIARTPGERTRVTGTGAQRKVHELRAGFDGIVVGGRTARIDDPRLTVRGPVEPRVPPARIVLDPEARLPPDAALLREPGGRVLVFAAGDAPEEAVEGLRDAGAGVERVGRSPEGVELGAVLAGCWELGVRSLLVEGGGRLARTLLLGGHVRRIHLFVAPAIFGEEGVPGFPGAWPDGIPGGWSVVESETVGPDAHLVLEAR